MPEAQYFRPRNWAKFQHYGKRNPPWIKLHKSLLRDADFCSLSEKQQLICIKIWLLYADTGRPLVLNSRWIGAQLTTDSRSIGRALPALIDSKFIELCDKNASAALAECLQDASPETETETETDTSPTERAADAASLGSDDLKSRIFGGGLGWLREHTGKTEPQARALLGKWCRDHGDGNTLEALIHAARDSPVDPISAIEHRLRDKRPKYARGNGATKPGPDLQRLLDETEGFDGPERPALGEKR